MQIAAVLFFAALLIALVMIKKSQGKR